MSDLTQTDSTLKGPQNDVSRKAMRVGRIIDRLLPGRYVLMLVLPEPPNQDWELEIFASVRIQRYVVYEERKAK